MTYKELLKKLSHLEKNYKVKVIGKTKFNRKIFAVERILNESFSTAIFVASVHARENIATDLIFEMIEQKLFENVCKFNLAFIVMANPDGVALQCGGIGQFSKKWQKKLIQMNGDSSDFSMWKANALGVDINNNFTPEYVVLKDKTDIVAKLKDLASKADHIYLATDPDREGEAISWHLSEVLEQPKKRVSRIVFNEITKSAILKAIANDRDIDMNLVHSQETRRILDRIIGFRLSSLMQQKLGSKSAGRVQSVALKLVVDREKEINAFQTEKYWDITAYLLKETESASYHLKGKLIGYKGEKIEVTKIKIKLL